MWGRISRNGVADARSGLFFDAAIVAAASIRDGSRLSVIAAARNGEAGLLDAIEGRPFDLASSALTSVLPAGSYQMLLVDLPSVPDAELHSAVRWQIKDLLDCPVEDAVVELFDIPEQSIAADRPAAYAVVARRDELQQHVDSLHKSGIRPAAIDIPELCMRNIAARLPQDESGVAMLHLNEDRGMLTVTRQGLLYFSRVVDAGTHSLAATGDAGFTLTDHASAIVLDVQRSLDYYESHYDRRPVSELVLACAGDTGRLPDMLREQLALAVTHLDLSGHFDIEGEIPVEHYSPCVLAVGAALRDQRVATRDRA